MLQLQLDALKEGYTKDLARLRKSQQATVKVSVTTTTTRLLLPAGRSIAHHMLGAGEVVWMPVLGVEPEVEWSTETTTNKISMPMLLPAINALEESHGALPWWHPRSYYKQILALSGVNVS